LGQALLYSKIIGKGEPFLILHGYFGMGDNWKTFATHLSENYQVHLIDLRNHGRSFHDDEFNYDVMVEDVLTYIKHYKFKQVTVLGHSMGGKIAMLLAVTYPEVIKRLIVADIAPKYYPPHHQEILEGLNSVDFNKQKTRKEVEQVLQQYIADAATRQFLLRNVYWQSKEKLAFRFNLKSLTENSNEVGEGLPSFTEYNGPVLFLKGGNSGYISKQDVPLIKAHFPNAKLMTVKNSGHWLHVENPTDFYEYIVDFLSKN